MKVYTLFCFALACSTWIVMPDAVAASSNEVPNTVFSTQQRIFTEGKRWIRTIWEARRSQLPKNIISGVKRAGFVYENIDDNDNMVVDNPEGRFYAVQIDRDDYEPIFLMSRKGVIVRKINHDDWNDGRWIDDGEDHFDEGDDEWDDLHGKREDSI